MSQETAAPVTPETRQLAGPSPLIGNGLPRSASITPPASEVAFHT
jgi:hypothetical protein